MRAFDEHDIWYAPVNDYEQVESRPAGGAQRRGHGSWTIPRPARCGCWPIPVRYDGQAPALRRMPPALGEHTREVLAEAGYSPQEIEQLLAEGVALAAQGGGAA